MRAPLLISNNESDMEYYFMISSADSKSIHTSNTAFDFIVELPSEAIMNGEWEFALTEFHLNQTFHGKGDIVYVLCDLTVDNFALNYQLPVLRRIQPTETTTLSCVFTSPYYMRVSRERVKEYDCI